MAYSLRITWRVLVLLTATLPAAASLSGQRVRVDDLRRGFAVARGVFQYCIDSHAWEHARPTMMRGVTIYSLRCASEHGDSVSAYVAAEDDGNIYPLGSELTYAYLVRKARTEKIDSTNILPYLKVALPLAGAVLHPFTIVTRAEDLPMGARESVRATAIAPAFTASPSGLWTVRLTVVDGRQVRRLSVAVATRGRGEVSLLGSEVLWTDPSVH